MAKFTAAVPLNIKWHGHSFVGQAGTTHRLTDALVEEFTEEVVPGIPGFAWVTQDELTSIVTLPIGQTDVTGLTAALAAKYDKTGGIISGATTVTGALNVGGAATLSSTLGVGGAATLSSTLSAGATTTGALVVQGATTVTSTAVIQGAATVGGTLTAQNNVNATNSVTGSSGLFTGIVTAGSSASVAGKLTVGGVLTVGGTAFPGSPANKDIFYRTDLDILFFFDGTRWLSTTLFRDTYRTQNLAATGNEQMVNPASALGSGNVWGVAIDTVFFVNGGTALSGSHKWVGLFAPLDSSNALGTTIKTITIDSGSSSTWRRDNQSIGALIPFNTSTHPLLVLNWTKTGTPGNLFVVQHLLYRIVAT